MKKRFKKIYIEITNRCNLSCSFCDKSNRKLRDMSVNEFAIVINKIKEFTDYIYLHVKGEPLLYSDLDFVLSICDDNNIKVNITTNGLLLKEKKFVLLNHSCVRQVNVSLHCENNKSHYFEDVFESCDELSTRMYINYRLWLLDNMTLDKKSTIIVDKIISHYKISTDFVNNLINDKQTKIFNNIYVDKDNKFDWPNINNNINTNGYCYGLNTHLGILSDGTVVPCCLDYDGVINLGNIFETDLETILDSDLVKNIINGFQNNTCYCDLCKHCNFRDRFN